MIALPVPRQIDGGIKWMSLSILFSTAVSGTCLGLSSAMKLPVTAPSSVPCRKVGRQASHGVYSISILLEALGRSNVPVNFPVCHKGLVAPMQAARNPLTHARTPASPRGRCINIPIYGYLHTEKEESDKPVPTGVSEILGQAIKVWPALLLWYSELRGGLALYRIFCCGTTRLAGIRDSCGDCIHYA